MAGDVGKIKVKTLTVSWSEHVLVNLLYARSTSVFNDEQHAVKRKEYFVLATMNPETIRTSELNCPVISLDMLTSLGQPTIRLRRYGWETSTEGRLWRIKKKKKKNKVEEIHLANLARASQATSHGI